LEGLGINAQGLIVQIINFILLFLLFRFTVYKYLVGLVDKRSARIKESLDQAEAIKKQTADAEEEIKKHIDEARQEGQALISQANQIGDRVKTDARDAARQEGEAIVQRASAEIQRERDEAIDQVRKEFAVLTVLAAEKVIEKSLDSTMHKKLIEDVLAESGNLQKGKS